MTALRYNKRRLLLLLIGGVALTIGCGWIAVARPHVHNGRYQALLWLLGPTGTAVFFMASTLFMLAASIAIVIHLLGDGVAARITPQGLVLSDVWGTRALAWADLHGIEPRTRLVQRRTLRWTVIHHAPCRVGPFTRRKASLMHDHLIGGDERMADWVEALTAAFARARQPSAPTEPRSPATPPRGFGRRGAAQPTSA